MSVTAELVGSMTVKETLADNVPAANSSKKTITHDAFNWSQSLSSTSTPVATKVAAVTKVLSSGAGALDMTALLGTNGITIDATGLHIRGMQITAPSGNGANITVAPAESDGYNLFGGAAGAMVFHPGDQLTMFCKSAQAVASNAKDIDLTGTGSSDSLNILFLLG